MVRSVFSLSQVLVQYCRLVHENALYSCNIGTLDVRLDIVREIVYATRRRLEGAVLRPVDPKISYGCFSVSTMHLAERFMHEILEMIQARARLM